MQKNMVNMCPFLHNVLLVRLMMINKRKSFPKEEKLKISTLKCGDFKCYPHFFLVIV
jgi:hypothetical protein